MVTPLQTGPFDPRPDRYAEARDSIPLSPMEDAEKRRRIRAEADQAYHARKAKAEQKHRDSVQPIPDKYSVRRR